MNDGKLIPLRIKLPYGSEDEFIDRYGSNVARGGIFVATRTIKPEGTAIAFEFVLASGARLLRGEAVVAKAQIDRGGQRAGMTLRFTRLDAQSKALVDRVVAHRSGEHRPPASVAPAVEPVAEPPVAPPLVEAAPAEVPPPSERASPPPAEPAQPEPHAPAPETDPAAAFSSTEVPEPASAAAPSAPAPASDDSSAERASPPPRPVVEARLEDFPTPQPPPKRRRSMPELEIPQAALADRARDYVLGIDLGTTNSRVAVYRNGKAELVPVDADGRSFALPSVVALDQAAGSLVVGDAARTALVRDPSSAVFAAKRLLGQRARSPSLTTRTNRLPYAVVADRAGDAAVKLGDDVHSMAELSSVLLKELKDAASRHLGQPVSRAVVCVPAYFTDHQRSAMLEAARLAGLEVLRVFNEPTSVALAFGYGKALPRKRILVYDLGGGTFGASVVEVTGDDLEVVATGGDNFLGGMDFDERVASELSTRFAQGEHKLDTTPVGQERLRDTSERAKISLSEQQSIAIRIAGGATNAEGATVDLEGELSRERLEQLTAALVERTIEVTRAVLASANLTAEKLDEVLLVGGQSKAPLVRRRVQELIGKPLRTDVDAQAAVALGAAILGHALDEAARGKPGVTLSEVLSAPIGIGVRGGGVHRIFERNTRLPAEKTLAFPVHEGQSVGIAVFQGDGAQAEQNEYLGRIEAPADRTGEVTLHFALTADGTLNLTAISPTGRREIARMSTADATEDARAAMLAQSPLGVEQEQRPAGRFRKGLQRLLGR